MIEHRSPRVYQLSVFVLAVEWIVFGSMHFTDLEGTIRQIPDFIPPSWLAFVAIATGVIEVVTGMLILMRKTRRLAAWTTLLLLAAFVLSIYKMLAHPEVRYFGAADDVMRVLLVPNHILMALCAIYLIRWPDKPVERVPNARDVHTAALP